MIKTMNELTQRAKAIVTKTLVVALANDDAVMEAVELARKDNIISAVLVGDEKKIRTTVEALGYDMKNYETIHESDTKEACRRAVALVSENDGYFLMKGNVDTATILKAALDKDIGLRTANRLSHVTVMETKNYHKLFLMTDGAMNIEPDVDVKQEIIENATTIAQSIGIDRPYVGCLAAVEKINPKMQATLDAAELKKRSENGIIKAVVDGPFALDNAINKEAAITKGITSKIAGDVDILLMPMIEAGNIFYKAMMFLADARSASVIAGAKKPIVLTSRADSTESKYHSIALSALVADLK